MKLSITQKIIIGVAVFSVLGFVLLSTRKSKVSLSNVLFLGGLDTGDSYLNITQQTDLLKQGLGEKYNVQSFRHTKVKDFINQINKDNKVIVVLFSAGCSKSFEIAKKMKESNQDLTRLYIVEPYAKSSTTSKSVRDAVRLGVPSTNVLVGNHKGAGLGIVENATPTPKCNPAHWCSLTEVGKIISSK